MYRGGRMPVGLPSTKQKSQWLAQRRMRGGSRVTPIASPWAFHIVLHSVPVRLGDGQDELLVRRQELPIQEVLERAAVDRVELRSRDEPEFRAERAGRHRLNTNHAPAWTSRTL